MNKERREREFICPANQCHSINVKQHTSTMAEKAQMQTMLAAYDNEINNC